MLCGGLTNAMKDLPLMKHSCTSEPGLFVFRVDTNNPDQADYDCTPTLASTGDPIGSYYCRWNDASETSIDMTFLLSKPQTCGIMAYDTQKYEDGDDPSIADPDCQVLYTKDPSTLTFSIDPAAASPACGARVTDTGGVKTIEITLRAYYDSQFDVAQDVIYNFSCSTDAVLPAAAELYKEFNANLLVPIPTISRSLQLLVSTPSGDVLSEVQIGQLFQFRIVYDNTANNIDPYGVYVEQCVVADTMDFDVNTFQFIEDGCVVEENPKQPWYITRSFKQTSLSADGLFIADSGQMIAIKFSSQEKIFCRCVVNFCFFIETAPNKCTDSCAGGTRRKRSINETDISSQTLYTSVIIKPIEGANTFSVTNATQQADEDCIDRLTVFLVIGVMGFIISLILVAACLLFRKFVYKRSVQ